MSSSKLRVAVVGVGNCASSLVQGVTYYRNAEPGRAVPGLMNVVLGGYHIHDIEFSAAFDIHEAKVGRDLADAILAPPNNTHVFARVPPTGALVHRGPTLDGRGRYVAHRIPESAAAAADVARILRATGSQIVVCYLPVGSEQAARHYAEAALQAGCAFVNCIPVFIASDAGWQRRFAERGLPVIGDDIKSQVGATIVHRALVRLFRERGVRLDRTYQLNFGGNTDFENMLERDRLESKKISKTRAVLSELEAPLDSGCAHVGPSDHVPWLQDRKWCYIRMEGTSFGDVPLHCELKLEVWDSPNSAGVVIDALRCARLALDRGVAGPLVGPSSWFMKSPPQQFADHEAQARTLAFIAGASIAGEEPRA